MNFKLLLIEDEEDLIDILSFEILNLYPELEIYSASNMNEVSASLTKLQYDLIISDLSIPGSERVPVLEAISNHSEAKIIIFTGKLYTGEDTTNHPQAVDTLKKPYCRNDLTEKLERYIPASLLKRSA